jgi:hypothetical protein
MNRTDSDALLRHPRHARPWGTSLALVAALSAVSAGQTCAADDDIAAIELRRLLEPTPAEIAQEEKGRIYIYDGLSGRDIERAMSEEFDRVEHMMFIRVRKTDADGEPVRDPDTGAAEVEDDGC